MANHFFISDTHFGHENILRFTDDKGNRIRPFDSLSHMHEYMIEKWNSVVKPGDRVYVLGDVVINKQKGFPVLNRLNGKKLMVAGNHDPFDTLDYLEYFEKIYGVRVMKGAVFTHVPVHPHSLNDRSWKVNVHGHLHANIVRLDNGHPDLRYINVSCEQLDYTPIALEDLRKMIWSRGVDKEKYPLTFY